MQAILTEIVGISLPADSDSVDTVLSFEGTVTRVAHSKKGRRLTWSGSSDPAAVPSGLSL